MSKKSCANVKHCFLCGSKIPGIRALIKILIIFNVLAVHAFAVQEPDVELESVGVKNHLGEKIDLNASLFNSDGNPVTLRGVMDGKTAIIVPAYYHCPRLCGLLLDGVLKLLNATDLVPGQDFKVITVSFDPVDNQETASTRAESMRSKLDPKVDKSSWQFLYGDAQVTASLMDKLGFEVKPDGKDFSHTAAIFFITPRGEISQYFAGIEFDPKSTRLALVEASQGAIGGLLDQVFLFCFRYDHMHGKYVWVSFSIMRAGGLLTLSFLALLIYRLWRKDQNRKGLAPS